MFYKEIVKKKIFANRLKYFILAIKYLPFLVPIAFFSELVVSQLSFKAANFC